MGPSSGDDFVILKCSNRNSIEADSSREILVSTSDVHSWDFASISSYQTVKFQVNRNRLIELSSYFHGLLSGSFSESLFDCISIEWSLETFMNILKFICGCPIYITSHNFLPLFEGALYFGVETLLFKCKTWLSEIASSVEPGPLQIPLDDLIHIWEFGLEHANDFIPELCASYLAKFFMLAISCNFFLNLPYNLLVSCLKHPHLTVDSEMHLSDALLVWLDANTKQLECLKRSEDDCPDILRQIRLSLLPLWFASGKRRSCYFAELAEESIEAIFSLVDSASTSLENMFGDGELHLLKIRLTEYTKKVNLSGCPQITLEILLLAVSPPYSLEPTVRKRINRSFLDLERFDRECPISRGLVPVLSFGAVEEVDISNCPKLIVGAAIECFSKSFPSLRRLKAAFHLNLKITALGQLVQKCPLVSEVDLKVDTSPVIPAQVSIISSSSALMPSSTKSYSVVDYPFDARSVYHSGLSQSSITKLSLEGRSDVYDSDLQYISKFCASLCYLNLKGCISVTDAGISNLICRCVRLHSIMVCDTSFGTNSLLALCSGIHNPSRFPDADIENKNVDSLAPKLQILHMGGCKGVDEMSLVEFLSQAQTLRSLCLMDTHLFDRALCGFSGSSLEMLDVSNTMVSGAALAHVVHGNPGLKCLKAKGCKNLFQKECSTKEREFSPHSSFCKELYFELGKACKLEEIAIGWGFSCFSLEALKPAITSLRAITVGLGGSLGEEALNLLPTTCPMLESVILHFQVMSDAILRNIMESLRHLRELALCYCLGDISVSSFQFTLPNLRKLRLERVTPWMTNDNLVLLTQNCSNLVGLSLIGCKLLNSDTQNIISHGWPGLISLHLEECGKVTEEGISSLFNCKALEDLSLCHNGPGIEKNSILDAASKLPMLRKVSLDLCDAREGDFDIPNFADRYFLSNVKIARCKSQRCASILQFQEDRRRPVHKETLVLVWNSKNLIRTVVKERV